MKVTVEGDGVCEHEAVGMPHMPLLAAGSCQQRMADVGSAMKRKRKVGDGGVAVSGVEEVFRASLMDPLANLPW
eukprot:758295-Hanusia_phi.AAC.3